MNGNSIRYTKSLSKNLKQTRHFENLSIEKKKILKLVLKKQRASACAGFIWL